MARKRLKTLLGQRLTFVGRFVRYGVKPGFVGPERTILFDPLYDDQGNQGDILCSHIWLGCGSQFESLGKLKKGDKVRFNARVVAYAKGYQGHDEALQAEKPLVRDYHLSRPSRVKKLTKGPVEPLPSWSIDDLPEAPGDE